MSLLIVEAFELVDLPLPDTAEPEQGMPSEFDRKLAYWTNALVSVVPLEALRASFDLATNRHTDPRRPVNPIEVKEAYPDVTAARARSERAQESESFLGPCEHCGVGVREDATERVAEKWIPPKGVGVMLPCAVCRPKQCAEAWRQYCERNPQTVPSGPIAEVVQAGKKLGEDLACSSCGQVINTYLSRKRAGDKCGRLLNASTSDVGDEGEVDLCDGILGKV